MKKKNNWKVKTFEVWVGKSGSVKGCPTRACDIG